MIYVIHISLVLFIQLFICSSLQVYLVLFLFPATVDVLRTSLRGCNQFATLFGRLCDTCYSSITFFSVFLVFLNALQFLTFYMYIYNLYIYNIYIIYIHSYNIFYFLSIFTQISPHFEPQASLEHASFLICSYMFVGYVFMDSKYDKSALLTIFLSFMDNE